jgi:hypothetical protein
MYEEIIRKISGESSDGRKSKETPGRGDQGGQENRGRPELTAPGLCLGIHDGWPMQAND